MIANSIACAPDRSGSDTRKLYKLWSAAFLYGETAKGLYSLNAWVIMPNHVHVLLTLRQCLPDIMRWIKSASKPAQTRFCIEQGRFGNASIMTIVSAHRRNILRSFGALSGIRSTPGWSVRRKIGIGRAPEKHRRLRPAALQTRDEPGKEAM